MIEHLELQCSPSWWLKYSHYNISTPYVLFLFFFFILFNFNFKLRVILAHTYSAKCFRMHTDSLLNWKQSRAAEKIANQIKNAKREIRDFTEDFARTHLNGIFKFSLTNFYARLSTFHRGKSPLQNTNVSRIAVFQKRFSHAENRTRTLVFFKTRSHRPTPPNGRNSFLGFSTR